ncbi:hypothetical protein AF70_00023330 [Pseudomonas sp. KD5]|nr:hypothetical protein [Pseudomonas sp. KD5]
MRTNELNLKSVISVDQLQRQNIRDTTDFNIAIIYREWHFESPHHICTQLWHFLINKEINLMITLINQRSKRSTTYSPRKSLRIASIAPIVIRLIKRA